jgi:hypothetical protein
LRASRKSINAAEPGSSVSSRINSRAETYLDYFRVARERIYHFRAGRANVFTTFARGARTY